MNRSHRMPLDRALVRHAIEQGITTVAMTGRFLRSLTHDGFLWLPGVKYRWKGVEGDLDLIACCDGHLVVGECKSLETTPSDAGAWNQVLEQFRTTVELARAVRAEVVVLSALAEAFPDDFRANAQEMMDPSMRLLLLDRQDLEKGRRMVDVPGSTLKVPLRIDDLIPDPMPEVPWNRPPEPRVLRTPYYIFTF
ncbi:MAG TPA: hypothetical protein VIL46_09570 [Gemmataceae bacterium]